LFFGNNDVFRLTSLQRLSFFLYSCERDLFQSKLKTIISHVKDFLVEQKKVTNRESQVYLILRVLFIRFSHDNLFEVLRQLWPMIYSDIVQKLIHSPTSSEKKEIDIKFAVLKFLEFLSIVNKEYFSAFQWVFFQDTNNLSRLRLNEDPEKLFIHKCFRPLAMELLGNYKYSNEFNTYSQVVSFDDLEKEPSVMAVSKVK
jgi:hypothetical protein